MLFSMSSTCFFSLKIITTVDAHASRPVSHIIESATSSAFPLVLSIGPDSTNKSRTVKPIAFLTSPNSPHQPLCLSRTLVAFCNTTLLLPFLARRPFYSSSKSSAANHLFMYVIARVRFVSILCHEELALSCS